MSIPLPKLSSKKRGRQDGDPPNSERGKSVSRRKSARDGGLTPTEQHRKNALMKQFMRLDGPKGASPEYRANYDAIDWGRG